MSDIQPNEGVSGPGTRAGRPLVIAIIVASVLAVGGVLVFRGSTGRDPIAARVPALTDNYLQVTLQPALSQKRLAEDLAAALPGGEDQLEAAIDQALESALSEIDLVSYSEVKPWLGDEIAVMQWRPSSDSAPVSILVAHSKDDVLAQDSVDDINAVGDIAAELNASFVTVAPTDEVLDQFEKAVRTNPLTRDKSFRSARARVGGDGIMLGRSNLDALNADQIGIASTSLAQRPTTEGSIVGGVKLIDGGLEMTLTEETGFLQGPLPKAAELTLLHELAEHAHVAVGFNDLATLFRQGINAAEGEIQDFGDQVGLDVEEDLLSWLGGQTAMRVVVFPDDEIHGSLVVEATDETKMRSFVQTLRALASLAGEESGVKIEGEEDNFSIRTEDFIANVTIEGARLTVDVSTPSPIATITDAPALKGIPEGDAAFAGAFNVKALENMFGADFPTHGPFAGYGQAISSIGFSAIADENGPRLRITALFEEEQ